MRARWLPGVVLLVLLPACNWIMLPVNPIVRFSAYQVPFFRQEEFAKRFASWRSGRPVAWSVSYRSTAHSDSAVVIPSSGPATYGAQLTGAGGRGGTFTPSRADLIGLYERLLEVKLFDLYDGHYGAYDQGGGLLGPEIRIEVGGLLKHLSYDVDLSPSLSWEAGALKDASTAIASLALRYMRQAQRPSPAPSAATPAPVAPVVPTPSVTLAPTPSVTVKP